MRWVWQMLTLCWLMLVVSAPNTGMAAERLDDSASPRNRVAAPLVLANTGGLLAESEDATQAILQFGRVDYRLATAAFVGKEARIYYVLPASVPGLLSPAGMRLEWRGNGVFADGVANAGERVLVWSGRVNDVWLNEGLDLTLYVDLAALRLSQGENFGFEAWFEIEVLP
ncbi:hypothetical protein [Thiothrix sp. UBA2332]|uniref:hypothetical protein n=2 Tax=Thiothrix TaxID=1030 RepID=UPI0025D497FF|nr:hypothetical protein [Thiothrix sp. UBA2332]